MAEVFYPRQEDYIFQLNKLSEGLGSVAGNSDVGVTNLNALRLPRLRAALGRAKSGRSKVNIAFIGDSTTSGVGSNPLSATSDSRRRAYPARVAKELNGYKGLVSSFDSIFCDGFEGANIENFDPRVSFEDGWEFEDKFGVGGYPFIDRSTTSPRWNFTPYLPTDTLDVYYYQNSDGGDYVVSTGGAFNGSINTSGTGVVKVAKITRELSSATWTIQKSSLTQDKTTTLLGVDAYQTGTTNISLWNMGASGSKAGQWAASNTPYSFVNAIYEFKADAAVICLTINDWVANTDPADYKLSIQKLVDSVSLTADVILAVGVPSTIGAATKATQDRFAQYIYELGKENNAPVLDFSKRWVSNEYMPDRNFYADGLHPSDAGYVDIGSFVAPLLVE